LTFVYFRFKNKLIYQSINQNLRSALSRSVLRGAPDPGQLEKHMALSALTS